MLKCNHDSAKKLLSRHYSLPLSISSEPKPRLSPHQWPLGVSLSLCMTSGAPPLPEKLAVSPHNVYTVIWKWQLFENSPWLSDIKSDFSGAECLAREGGMAADSRTMRCARHQRLNGLCSRRKGRRPFVLSHIQLFLTRASFHNKREFNFNAISEKVEKWGWGGDTTEENKACVYFWRLDEWGRN